MSQTAVFRNLLPEAAPARPCCVGRLHPEPSVMSTDGGGGANFHHKTRSAECERSVIWILCDGLGLEISFPLPRSLKACPSHCPPPKKPRGGKLLMNTPPADALPKSFAC